MAFVATPSSFRESFVHACNEVAVDPHPAVIAAAESVPDGLSFSLTGHSLSPKICQALANTFKDVPYLVEVSISDSFIGDRSSVTLLRALSQSSNLRRIHLRACSLGADGINALAQLLQSPGGRSIRSLSLEWNDLGTFPAPTHALLVAAAALPALTSLDLRNNAFDPDGSNAIVLALAGAPALQSLDLRWNPLGPNGGTAVCDLVTDTPTLTDVQLSGCGVPFALAERIQGLLAHNKASAHEVHRVRALQARHEAERATLQGAADHVTRTAAREIDTLAARCRSAEEAVDVERQRAAAAEFEARRLRTQLEELDTALRRRDDELATAVRQRAAEQEVATAAATEQLEAAHRELTSATERQTLLLQQANERLQAAERRMRAEHEAEVAALRGDRDAALTALDDAAAHADDARRVADRYRAQLESLERGSADSEHRINALMLDCDAWRGRYEDAARDRAADASARRELERQLQEARSMVERATDDLTTATSRLGAFEERSTGLEREATALRLAVAAAEAATAAARVDTDRTVARVRAEAAAERQADTERFETRLAEVTAQLRALERDHSALQATERAAAERAARAVDEATSVRAELTQVRTLSEQSAMRAAVTLREREMEASELTARLQSVQREAAQQRDAAADQLAHATAQHRKRERELADERAASARRVRELEEDIQRLRQRSALIGGKALSITSEVETAALSALRRVFQDGTAGIAALFPIEGAGDIGLSAGLTRSPTRAVAFTPEDEDMTSSH